MDLDHSLHSCRCSNLVHLSLESDHYTHFSNCAILDFFQHFLTANLAKVTLNMAGPSRKAGRSSEPEVIITSQNKVCQPSATSQENIGKGVSTRRPRKASSQRKDKADDTDSDPNNGDERPSDDDWGDSKKSKSEREKEKAKERLKWITDWRWKSTPSKKKELSIDEYWNMILLRDSKMERQRDTIRQKNKTIADMRDGKVQRLNGRLQGKSTELEDVQRQNDSLKITLQELQGELEKSKGEVDAREVAISGMAAERLNLLDKSDMPFLPDDVVATTFNKLFRETREWVKKWVITDWSKMQQKDAMEVARRLQHNMSPNFISGDAAEAVMRGKVPTRVILLAIVNVTLCRRTFMRPFDLIKTTGTKDAPREGKDRLQTVYNYLRERRCFLPFHEVELIGPRHITCSPPSTSFGVARLLSTGRDCFAAGR